jgi:hypothetical protein
MKMEQSVPKRQEINSYTGESPRRKNTTFRTRRKFEIKKAIKVYLPLYIFVEILPDEVLRYL